MSILQRQKHQQQANVNPDFDFAERWSSCLSWFDSGPKSYMGKYYVKRWGDELEDPIEQILVDAVPDEVALAIEIAQEEAANSSIPGMFLSERLFFELPYRNSINADYFREFAFDADEIRDHYLSTFNPYKKLSEVFALGEANCIAHNLAVKEVLEDKSWQLFNIYYDNTEQFEHLGKIGVHGILAKYEHGEVFTFDSSEGPINNKDKNHPFSYIMSPKDFCRHYIPANFVSSPIIK